MMEANIAPIIAAVAAASAAATAKRNNEKEEVMARYNSDDLNGWEFKIVRANTRKFRKQENIEKVREEEARAGWELVEKFDDHRLRFKRRVDRRSMDSHSDVDPYRSSVDSFDNNAKAIMIGLVLLTIGILVALGFFSGFDRGIMGGLTVPGIILILAFTLGIIAIVAFARSRR